MTLKPFNVEITPQEFKELKVVVAAAKDYYDIFAWLHDHNAIALDSEIIEMLLEYDLKNNLFKHIVSRGNCWLIDTTTKQDPQLTRIQAGAKRFDTKKQATRYAKRVFARTPKYSWEVIPV